jgi:hypothetical protein
MERGGAGRPPPPGTPECYKVTMWSADDVCPDSFCVPEALDGIMRCADCVRLRSRSTTISLNGSLRCRAQVPRFDRCVGGRARCAPHATPGPPPSLFSASCACCISSNSKRLLCVSTFSPPASACPPTPTPSGLMPAETLETGPCPLC